MEKFLFELMQQGYIVYQKDDDCYCLQKCEKLGVGECISTSLEGLLETAKQKIKWEEVPTLQSWDLELMYKHRAFKTPRFEGLGQIHSLTYDEAVQEANDRADVIIVALLDVPESWEVRVCPSKT